MASRARDARSARIVDLNAFKAARTRPAAAEVEAPLPLFDGEPAPADPPPARERRRDLSDREVEHRRRMLEFLGATADR